MDSLRPADDESAFDENDGAAIDPHVIDRLSAYSTDPARSHPDEASETTAGPTGDVPAWTGEPPAEPPELSFGAKRAADIEDVETPTFDRAGAVQEPAALEEAHAEHPAKERAQREPASDDGVAEHAVDEAVVAPVAEPGAEATEEIEVRAVDAGLAADTVDETPAGPDEPEAAEAASGDSARARKWRPALRRRRGSGEADDPPSGTAERPKRRRAKAARSHDRKAKKLVGLKIGASQIAAAHVVNNGVPEIVELHREPLEPGVVVFGEIRDPDALGDALGEFFARHKLPRRGIRIGISNNRVGVRIFEVDGVEDREHLENAILFRAEEVLPIPLDEAVLDYAILDESVLEDGTPRKRILLVVAYREVVDRYLQACARAGLQVVGIDHEAFALLRSLELPDERDPAQGALVAVAIGHDRTTIAVSTGRQCEFTRVLDWGGWSLNVAIARELNRAPSEVEQVKRRLSFAHDTEVDGLASEQVAKARNGMARALEAFARELVSSLQFYQAQPGALGIGEIVLTGGTAHMDGLPAALGQIVGVPIRLGDPFKRVKVGAKVEQLGERGSLAIAIGLGIED